MRKLFSWIIILLLLISRLSLAESGNTSDVEMFDIAIAQLRQMDSRESIADAQEMFEDITSNYNQAKSFVLYTTALLNIYDGAFDEAEAQIAVLKMNTEFAGLLKENGLQSCDVLQTYIRAKQSDDAGDITKALQMYSDCMGFMDSQERSVALIVKAYNNALEMYNNGQYEEAVEIFEILGDYKDSQEMVEKAKALLPTPTPVPTPTPTPTPSPSPTPTPTPTPTPSPSPTPIPTPSPTSTPSNIPKSEPEVKPESTSVEQKWVIQGRIYYF